MRQRGQMKMGYYPTPDGVVERVRNFLAFPSETVTCLDSCCGTGEALALLVKDRKAETYGVELDAKRAKAAKAVLDHSLHAAFEKTAISTGAFSLLFLNPPYDWEEGGTDELAPSERKELTFLRLSIKHLRPGGVLVYIIPQVRLSERIASILAHRFEGLSLWRFPDGEYEAFHQIVILGRRKAGEEPDAESAAKLVACVTGEIPELPASTDAPYLLPPGKPVKVFRSLSVDPQVLAGEVADSPLWRQLRNHQNGSIHRVGSPPLPLHTGHLALLMAAGSLNGRVGEGEDRHVVAGKVEKLTTETEEVREDGTLEERTLERYQVTIRLLLPTGEIRTLT